MKQKKAQIQNMETIAVVIIIIILIIFGLVYAANQRKGTAEIQKSITQDTNAMKLTTNTMNLDFVKCSSFEANLETCVDYHKIKALANHTTREENYLYFNNIFGNTKIELQIIKNITNSTLQNENITLYTTFDTENKTTINIRTPVTVKEPVKNTNYFAIMEVKVYR
ncbi:MAG: hypothetical protein ACLFN8_03180 [Candidatus Woesearchaeota archaeon]